MPHLPGKRAVRPLTCGGDKQKKPSLGERNGKIPSAALQGLGGGQGESEGWR